MENAILTLIQLAFPIAIGSILGNLTPRAVKDLGMRGRFFPCALVLTAISTAYFLFAVGMLEGWSQAASFSTIGLLSLAFILNAIVIVIAWFITLLLTLFAKLVGT